MAQQELEWRNKNALRNSVRKFVQSLKNLKAAYNPLITTKRVGALAAEPLPCTVEHQLPLQSWVIFLLLLFVITAFAAYRWRFRIQFCETEAKRNFLWKRSDWMDSGEEQTTALHARLRLLKSLLSSMHEFPSHSLDSPAGGSEETWGTIRDRLLECWVRKPADFYTPENLTHLEEKLQKALLALRTHRGLSKEGETIIVDKMDEAIQVDLEDWTKARLADTMAASEILSSNGAESIGDSERTSHRVGRRRSRTSKESMLNIHIVFDKKIRWNRGL